MARASTRHTSRALRVPLKESGASMIRFIFNPPLQPAFTAVNAGIRSFRTTPKHKEKRGIFCAIGRCTDCMMIVDGIPNTRTCVTPVRDGMHVKTQEGLGSFERKEEEA